MNAGFTNSKCAAFGKKTGAIGCNPSKPGYTMACPPYGFQLEPSMVSLRSLKPLLLHSGLKIAG